MFFLQQYIKHHKNLESVNRNSVDAKRSPGASNGLPVAWIQDTEEPCCGGTVHTKCCADKKCDP
jgi:hypothetical protein